jgi:Arc/MetJ-type ribon-helix-helix transcriptional regulator
MASITVGFSIPKQDEPRLRYLVERFGQGNRSAFLRAAMKHMEVLDRAERLDELSAYGAERLAAKGLSVEDIPALVKQVLARPPAE